MERSLAPLKVEIDEQQHVQLLARLRNTSTDLDDRRQVVEWRRGNIYFHPLQDLRVILSARSVLSKMRPDFIPGAQACFVKDFDLYFSGFPEEEVAMRRLFDEIFDVGTSFEWQTDLTRVRDLERVFTALDDEKIRPWVEEKN